MTTTFRGKKESYDLPSKAECIRAMREGREGAGSAEERRMGSTGSGGGREGGQ